MLDRVSLSVGPGEVVGILGPNGAGKTTIFKILLGIVRQDDGVVRYRKSLAGFPLHKRAALGLGYLPQGASVFRGMTVEGNLLAVLEARRRPDSTARAAALLEKMGLGGLAKQKAKTLSGGERRKLEFARALCTDPRILLVDEPFAGIDPIAAQEMSRAIVALSESGVGVLLTDHRASLALATCSRLYLIVAGRIVLSGAPAEIRNSAVARELYLGESAFTSE